MVSFSAGFLETFHLVYGISENNARSNGHHEGYDNTNVLVILDYSHPPTSVV